MGYRDRLIRDLADRECTRICRATIRQLQSIEHALVFGENAGLKNTWEEICIQRQMGELVIWQAYLDAITPYIIPLVGRLRRPEQEAIWLQTPQATEWNIQLDEDPACVPVCQADITDYILNDYVLHTADDYRNARIERYRQQFSDTDGLGTSCQASSTLTPPSLATTPPQS